MRSSTFFAVTNDAYVCPRCGADALGTSYCASCGLHLDAVELQRRSEFEGPRADLTEAEQPSATYRPEGQKLSIPKVLVMLVVIAFGATGMATPEDECEAFATTSEAAGRIVGSAVSAFVAFLIVATLVWLVRRARKKDPKWRLFDWTVIAIAGCFIVFGTIGAVGSRAQDCERATDAQVASVR